MSRTMNCMPPTGLVLLLLLVSVALTATVDGSENATTVASVPRRFCWRTCFIGRHAWRRAARRCPRRGIIVRCHRRWRHGFRCLCRPKHSPSPTPTVSSTPTPTPSPSASVSPAATFTATVIVGSNPNAVVLACTKEHLFIQVKNSSDYVAGNIYWTIPSKSQSLCSNCNTLVRKIMSVTSASSFGSTVCPSGSTCISVDTVYATLSDLVSESLLTNLGITAAGSTPVEPDYGCNLPTSSGMVTSRMVSNDVKLQNVLVRQDGAAVPASCSAWPRKNADGRCTYSDCFVGKDGDPVNCLFCKAKCDNGCGPTNPVKNFFIPDYIPLVFDFRESCCIHDKCYTSFFKKDECDEKFLRDNLSSCADEVSDILYFIPLPIPVIGSRLRCPALAQIYYWAVKYGGNDSYADAQKDRKKHEESDQCVARCPSTQRSGGQGVTTLNVDLKKTNGTFDVSYNMFNIPDQLEVFYEGATIFTTGGLVSGSRTVPVTYSGESTFVRVTITAPNAGTAWDVTVACPP